MTMLKMYIEFVDNDTTAKITSYSFKSIDIGSYISIGTNGDLIEFDVTTFFC